MKTGHTFALIAALGLMGMALVIPPADATTILKADLKQYVDVATGIVQATVVAQTPVFPESGMPYTEVRLNVTETLKGDHVGGLTIRVPGAVRGRLAVQVVSAPAFKDGEQVVLFLWQDADSEAPVVLGLDQGAYRVVPGDNGQTQLRGLHAASDESLDAFKAKVSDVVRRSSVQSKEVQR